MDPTAPTLHLYPTIIRPLRSIYYVSEPKDTLLCLLDLHQISALLKKKA